MSEETLQEYNEAISEYSRQKIAEQVEALSRKMDICIRDASGDVVVRPEITMTIDKDTGKVTSLVTVSISSETERVCLV